MCKLNTIFIRSDKGCYNKIHEVVNTNLPKFQVIKESQDLLIPSIDVANIPKRNGMISIYTGSGGVEKPTCF